MIEYRTNEQINKAAKIASQIGVSRYSVSFYDRLVFTEHVFRTVRKSTGYFIIKDQFTWGKLSKKHFDYGWINKNITPIDRTRFELHNGLPFHKTKLSALNNLIAKLKTSIKQYGPDFVDYFGDEKEPSLETKLKKCLTLQKRLRNKK